MSTWVLLRGLARERRHWGSFPDRLREAGVADTVVALDLPGNGALNRQPSPTRIESMAAWVGEELARRGVAPPYHVMALSLGGMVAVAWARAQPHAVSAAVLINTSMRPFNPFYQRLRPGAWWPLLLTAASGDAARRERRILDLTSNNPVAVAAVFPHWLACAREHPVTGINTIRQLWAAARFCAPLEVPDVPFLVLTSAADRMVHPDCSRVLARQWRCPLVAHPTAGHDLPLDDAPWVVGQVAQWLAERAYAAPTVIGEFV